MDIRQIQSQARELRALKGWNDTTLDRRVVFLVSEVGEVAKELLQLERLQHAAAAYDGRTSDQEAVKERLGMEIYDVIWNLCDLANLAEIDLEAAFLKKNELNREREW